MEASDGFLNVCVPINDDLHLTISKGDPAKLQEAAEAGAAQQRGLTLPSVHSDLPYWAEIWEVEIGLAQVLLGCDKILLSGAVLEIGAGTGIAGLALAKSGCSAVTFVDFEPACLPLIARNAALNGVSLAAAEQLLALDWRFPETWAAECADVVIASEVLYCSGAAIDLAGLLPRVVRPGGIVLLADPGRPYTAKFVAALAASPDFEVRRLDVCYFPCAWGEQRTRYQPVEFVVAVRHSNAQSVDSAAAAADAAPTNAVAASAPTSTSSSATAADSTTQQTVSASQAANELAAFGSSRSVALLRALESWWQRQPAAIPVSDEAVSAAVPAPPAPPLPPPAWCAEQLAAARLQ